MYYGEKLNSISHLVGAVLALMGLGALLTVSIQKGDPLLIFSSATSMSASSFTKYGEVASLLMSLIENSSKLQ